MIGMQSEAQVLSPLDYGQLSRHPDPLLHHISMKSVHEYPRNNRRRGFGNPAHAVRNSQNGAASSVDRDQKTSGILHSAITELLEKCILPFGENRRTLRRMVDQRNILVPDTPQLAYRLADRRRIVAADSGNAFDMPVDRHLRHPAPRQCADPAIFRRQRTVPDDTRRSFRQKRIDRLRQTRQNLISAQVSLLDRAENQVAVEKILRCGIAPEIRKRHQNTSIRRLLPQLCRRLADKRPLARNTDDQSVFFKTAECRAQGNE